jgi:hypothetical protein
MALFTPTEAGNEADIGYCCYLAHKASPNAQKNYERYLALARTEAQAGNPVGAENLPARRTLFQIDVFDPREGMAPAGGIKSMVPVLGVVWRDGAPPRV